MTLYRLGCFGLIGLGLLHLAVLGLDAFSYAGDLARGRLWTWEHWGPLAGQRPELVAGGFAFWSTIASFAVPVMGLGALLVDLDRRGVLVPRGVFIGLGVWLLVCSALMPPSGFPFALVVIAALLFARQGGPRRPVAGSAVRR